MVRVVKVTKNNIDYVAREAGKVIRDGGLVVYPTDTVYGLGANPFNIEAVNRVFMAKRRPRNKPLPILVSSIDVVSRIAEVNILARRIMEVFWPGPLTLVLPAKDIVPCIVTSCTGKIGVRMPKHDIALKIIEYAGGYVIGTSANLSGHSPPRTAAEAIEQLGDSVDLVIDAGPSPGGIPSTVIEIVGDTIKLVRRGPISLDEITRHLY